MLKKYKFLSGLVAAAMMLSSFAVSAFAAEAPTVSVAVAAVDYSDWVLGTDNGASYEPNNMANGKDAILVNDKNVYKTFDEAFSEGKITFSVDTYLKKGERNFRIYFENGASTANPGGSSNEIFAEVVNNATAGAVYFGPETDSKNDAHKLFDIAADGWFHFDITLDYGEMQPDGSVTENFITIKSFDGSGNPLAEDKTIGAIAGRDVKLRTIRLVRTGAAVSFANMSVEQGGKMQLAQTLKFDDSTVGGTPGGWMFDVSGTNTAEIVEDSTKNKKVLKLEKNYDEGSTTLASAAAFAQYNFPSEYEGKTRIEADVKVTAPGRIGIYAVSQPGSSIKTSTVAPRFFVWGDKNFGPLKSYLGYTGADKGTEVKNPAPVTDTWQTWVLEIDGKNGKYDVYVGDAQIYSGLNAGSSLFGETVGGVGFQIQKEDTTLGTILVSEIRVFNDSIVDAEKEIIKIQNGLNAITVAESTEGEAITLPAQAAGYDIKWTSSNMDVISSLGIVTRKETTIGDIEVTLTATITFNGVDYTKEFKVISLDKRDPDELVKSQILADLMDVGIDTKNEYTSDIELPTVGSHYGTAISWITSNASIISAKGKVTRPRVNGTKTVKLTAVGELGGVKGTYSYDVKVLGRGPVNGSGGNTGGGYVSSNGVGRVPIVNPIAPTAKPGADESDNASKAGFTDLDTVPWASEAIDYMFTNGYVNGVGNGLFAPQSEVTREQFVKMLVNVFGLTAVEGASVDFSDVNDGEWYADFVKIAASRGIVSGMGDGSFGVGAPISRQDMAVMIARCTNIMTGDEIAEDFADNSEISDYAVNAVYAMKSAGYLSGDNEGKFNPIKTATRAETATVLYRICNK